MASERVAGLGLRSAATFLVLALLFEVAVTLAIPPVAKVALCSATSSAAGSLIQVTGVPVSVFGSDVFLPSRKLAIDLECTAVYLIGVFAALTLAYPASWRQRVIGIAFGVPLVIVGNLLRLVVVARVSESWPAAFDFTHDLLFQISLVLWVLGTWGAWVLWTRTDET
ncbi:MAG: archaeosortase/exosortase family protein [Coriobacteriales bacterium]|nr:archaeosortase/exosortase family protein [Coriobacteriales bacterium]